MLLALLIVVPNIRDLGPVNPGPYSVYHTTGEWLAHNTLGNEQVLDLTDWSLYFSRRSGYNFANVYEAPADPHTRWIVVREGQIDGCQPYCQVIRDLIGGREPVAAVTGQRLLPTSCRSQFTTASAGHANSGRRDRERS